MCHPRDLLEKEQARLSPSQRDLELEQIMAPLERAIERFTVERYSAALVDQLSAVLSA